MKNKILEIIKTPNGYNKRRLTESFFKKNHYLLYEKILDKATKYDISFNAMLYMLLNDLNEKPVCVICGNTVRFRKFSEGFSKYCSMKCIGKDKNIQKKREKTTIKSIGVKYTLQSKDKQNQIKQTNLNKYGVEHPQKLESIKNKVKQTNLNKYGVEHHLKLKKQIDKRDKTCLSRYGVKNPMQNSNVILKVKQTKKDKYGDEKYINIVKQKQTNFNKYGVESVLENDEIKQKIINTINEKYGCSSYSKTNEFLKKVKSRKKEKYDNENYNNREKSKKTCLIKYGVDNPSKSIETIKKIQLTRNLKYVEKYSKLLNINASDIKIISSSFVKIRKYCDYHDFEISKSLLYSRLIHSSHENICTICNPISENVSILENELFNFIKSITKSKVIKNATILSNKQEIDIYLPEYNLGIEFNGLYWHSELFKEKNYHLNKTEECKKAGIKLLHIFEDEWIYKKEIIKSIIKSKMGIHENKIFGRNCEVKEIHDNELIKDFLNANHIQGFVGSLIKIGLYCNNELISVMTFEKARKTIGNVNNSNHYYHLNRFCTKINTHVIGGASKILNYFIKKYNPENIVSFADKRYSNGDLYKKIGFSLVKVNKPTYTYFNKNKKIRYHRFNFRKSKILNLNSLDENKSISENILNNGFYKIYDSGNIKYELNLKC